MGVEGGLDCEETPGQLGLGSVRGVCLLTG